MSLSPAHQYGSAFDELLARPPAWATADSSAPGPDVRLSVEDAFADQPMQSHPHAEACLAGLYLRLGQWEDAHRIVAQRTDREGAYWHGITHRLEPDPGNAAYWMSQVGEHPIHPDLCREAAVSGAMQPFDEWNSWQAEVFIDLWTESAGSGSDLALACRRIHDAEWRLLFDFCFQRATCAMPPG